MEKAEEDSSYLTQSDQSENESELSESDGESELGEFVPHPVEIDEDYVCVLCEFAIKSRGDSFSTQDNSVSQPTHSSGTGSAVTTFCPAYFHLTPAGKKILEHIVKEHNLVIADNDKIAHLPSYLEFWKGMLKGKPIQEYASTIATQPAEGVTKEFFLLSDILPEDREIREQLRTKRLNYLLKKQHDERTEAHFHRKCLFCRKEFDDRKSLFSHMYRIHSFNVGLPDNIVNTHHFLNILQGKINQYMCLYCEKLFKNYAVLKSHMRKKKHFKLNTKNKEYDIFYIINYLEEGKSWEALQSEDSDSDREDSAGFSDVERANDDEWDEWNEDGESSETKCLFCDTLLSSPEGAFDHTTKEHGFDFLQLKRDWKLDFYSCIKLVNYIRKQVANNNCPSCQAAFSSPNLLQQHMSEQKHFGVRRDTSFWEDTEYLMPVIENDPVLQAIGDDEDDVLAPVQSEDVDLESLSINEDLLRQCH